MNENFEWDAFISHASEDKSSFVRALASLLTEHGLKVWFDEFSLDIGDSLRRSVDEGLSNSQYGIVVLSKDYFRKTWTQRELEGLIARETEGELIILPIWHDVDEEDVRKYSPILAGRFAVSSSLGISTVAERLVRKITTDRQSSAVMSEPIDRPELSDVTIGNLVRALRNSGSQFTRKQIAFFKRSGVPEMLLEYLPTMLEANPIQFYSIFLSYSTKDAEFTDRLYADLKSSGVTTWKWNLDAVPGVNLRNNIDWAIRNFDKLVLVCSANSLASPQVEREIYRAFDKEDRIKKANQERVKEALAAGEAPPQFDANVLVPIRLDDSIFTWDSPVAMDIQEYYIPDFTSAKPGTDKYRAEFVKLMRALNPSSWPPRP